MTSEEKRIEALEKRITVLENIIRNYLLRQTANQQQLTAVSQSQS